MDGNKKLISNTIYLLLDWTAVSAFSFFYWMVAGKLLLPEQYGIISTSVNLGVLLSGVTMLGLGITVMKLIPEYLEKKQKKKISGLLRFSLKTILICNFIFIISFLIFSQFISGILKLPIAVIYITPIIMILSAFSRFYEFVLRGFQKMKRIAVTGVIGHFIKFALSAVLIIIGMSYFGPLIGFSMGMLVAFILRFFSVPLGFSSNKINKKNIMIEFAIPALVTTLSWILFLNGQYVILTAIQTPEVTGLFTIAMLLTNPIVVVPKTISHALFPIISQLTAGKNTRNKQSHLVNMAFRYSLLISLPLMIFVMLFSKELIMIFSRAEYITASSFFPILAVASIIYGCGNIFLSSIYAIGKPKLQRNIVILGTLIFLCISPILAYKLSATGMCFAYAISVSIISLTSFIYMNKLLKISLPWKSIGKIIFSAIFMFAFLYYMVKNIDSLFLDFIFVIIAGIIYLAVLIPLKFYDKQDFDVLEYIVDRTPILKKQMKKMLKLFLKICKK